MKKLILTTIIAIICQPVFSAQIDSFPIAPQPLINTNLNDKFVSAVTFQSLTKTINNIKNNSESLMEGLENATTRYSQTNVVAAYKDFSKVINSINGKNDFLYIIIARRLNSLGFFTLSQNALINLKDVDLWHRQIEDLKIVYNPAVTLTYEEEIYLTKLQTDTLYNNSAKETIKTLEKDDKITKKSDYANYVLAVAYFENKNYLKAQNTLNKAINKAPKCINYLHLKEKIYTQTKNYKAALRVIEDIEKTKVSLNYVNEILNNDKLYILMKMSKKDEAKYYSAKLLFQTGEYNKALKEAQAAISLNKKNIDAYVLIGDYYLKIKDIEKAKEYYMKAYGLKQKYAPVLLGLGHCYYFSGDYSTAENYYQKAYKYAPQDEQVLLSLANSLIVKNDFQNAQTYVKKLLKINANSDGAYYLLSKITPEMREQYLRTALSLNPTNVNAWLDLAELKINQKNYKDAQEYLFPVKIIDPENSRYSYLKKLANSKNIYGVKSSYNNDVKMKEELYNLVF